MQAKFAVFVAVSAILVATLYSSSAFIAFGAQKCDQSANNPVDFVCITTNKNGKITAVEYCYVDNNGKTVCIKVYQALTGPDIPPELRDAISKAQGGVKPDSSIGEGGNNTKVPKDLGGLNDNDNGPTTNPGSQ